MYHHYSEFEEAIVGTDDESKYNYNFPKVSDNIWSTYPKHLTNSSLPIFSTEHNTSTGTYTLEQSEQQFPLAKLLEESWWNVFDEKYLVHSWQWTVTLITLYMTIFIIGVIGNIMVILVVLQRHQMRTVTNMFIMNLAVADLSVIVFCVGPTLLANTLQPWILGSFVCKGVTYLQGVSVCASAYSLVAISLDRCYAVYRPLDRYQGISKSQAFKFIGIIWMTALIINLPWAVIFELVISDKDGLPYCNEVWNDEFHGKMYFLLVNLTFCYGLPVVFISASNAVVWCHVTNRNVPQESESAARIVKRVHRRVRENARKMLGTVTLTFLLSWLPLYIIVTRVKFATDMSESEFNFMKIIMPIAQWLRSLNSCIDPILYGFLNRKFREEFNSLLPSWILFFNFNRLLGLGMGGYGVNVSAPNLSRALSHNQNGRFRNSGFNRNRGHYIRRSVLVSTYRNVMDGICRNNVPISVFTIVFKTRNNSSALSITNNVTKQGTSGRITYL